MIVYGRYTSNGTKTWFLGIVELSDGRAVTITDALCNFAEKWSLTYTISSLLLMLGCWGGVSTLLKESVPYLIANHCVAHRLALGCG